MARPRIQYVTPQRMLRDKRYSAAARRKAVAEADHRGKILGLRVVVIGFIVLRRRELRDPSFHVTWGDLIDVCRRAVYVHDVAAQVVLRPALTVVPNGTPHVDFTAISPNVWQRDFGLTGYEQLKRLASALAFTDKDFIVPVEEALLAFMGLMHRPGRVSNELLRRLGVSWDPSKASKVVNKFATAVASKFQQQLEFDGRYFKAPWLEQAAAATRAKHRLTQGIIGFVDGTAQLLCSKGQGQQNAALSGNQDVRACCLLLLSTVFRPFTCSLHQSHVLDYQGVVLPNGLITSFCGPWASAVHESRVVAEKNLVARLDAALPDEPQYKLLGDLAYTRSDRVTHASPSSKRKKKTQKQGAMDRVYKSLQVIVEFAFGASGHGVTSRFQGVTQAPQLRMRHRPVECYMMTAILLSNMLVCDEQTSPVAAYYGNRLRIPTLQEYMPNRN
ncbi:uncharacterized protein MONBRDRAFT_10161 [Monosiga brevicollis MX1]|uniref:DDE Tnp4 domain-containing protein n=1 Tax=Monosiga brevicollis TaxID=81824 RepID=A9V5E0_MONBE|nr:uncharacterized protein MONBRDRAFT_10161 [Monosiga brevicollis MX1]EDQ87265.1 predicted protein [Monosiga brevicollis MX1]|eukprot:XP_001747878.1 hypothetical protein [Monosiga brevicollis MX1]